MSAVRPATHCLRQIQKDSAIPASGGRSRYSAMRNPLVLTSDWPLTSGQKNTAPWA